MTGTDNLTAAGGETSRRLCVYNGGFLTQKRLRRILTLKGWNIRPGHLIRPGPYDQIGVWGKSPTAHRGEAAALRHNAPLLRVEDAFLRSVHPGRTAGSPPMGLLLDQRGVHFDSSTPSDLEHLLATHRLDDTPILERSRAAMLRLARAHISKYNAFNPELAHPYPGKPYVLVIDQTKNDASIKHAGARPNSFREMLVFAQLEHPGMQILIKTHPETHAGFRAGHFGPEDENDHVKLVSNAHSPWGLLENARAVYTVSSGMGFEAIIAGHKPRVFGQPFYSGWGLTEDENPIARRTRKLTRTQLFAAAMILYPTWYDPHTDALCELEVVINNLEAQARAWREDHAGYVASGMRLWKRRPLQDFFGQSKRLIFNNTPKVAIEMAQKDGRNLLVWASKANTAHISKTVETFRVEDGFLRSRGLGAQLVAPLSLVRDDLGIYYDPNNESRLERLITNSPLLSESEIQRADALIAQLCAAKLTKYNLGGAKINLPEGHKILVPGQVEDDASIQLGSRKVKTNISLLQAVRRENPGACIIYKPHPDVEAGLRQGAIDASDIADIIADKADPLALIEAVDEVWTMTSLLGFEALMRGRAVTTLGAPFYAGWGLTRDLGDIAARRVARPTLAGLVHATLIDYPRYFDPITKLPCPVEVVVDRLQSGARPRRGAANKALSKLQGLFASSAHMWR